MGIGLNLDDWGKEIIGIEITLENCEDFFIPCECIEHMWTKGCNLSCHIQRDRIFQNVTVDEFFISFKNMDGIKKLENWSAPFLNRVLFNQDIAQILLVYTDGTKEWFCVPWGDDDSYNINSLQKNFVNPKGNFEITISKLNT